MGERERVREREGVRVSERAGENERVQMTGGDNYTQVSSFPDRYRRVCVSTISLNYNHLSPRNG